MDLRPLRVGALAAIGAVVLGGCATTAISSSIVPTTTSTTPPVTTSASPEAASADQPEVVAPPDSILAPTTTVAPLGREIIEVSALETAIPAIGTSSGEEAARLQQRLLDLGYWVQATDGEYGLTTRQAVMAFQKYEGLTPTGSLDEVTAARISEVDARPFGRAQAGTMVEVDKAKQLLFVIDEGQTRWVLNASTGSEIPYSEPNSNNPDIVEEGDSVTPVGLHKVNREREEGWWEGDLGQIYRPKYFRGGVAVHGANSVPEYPASHGCVRVSVPAMDWIWDEGLLPIGSLVWVHGDIPGATDGA
jgi:peptidoglycan hydrolase-like protein with peptidoglycan-binding domain